METEEEVDILMSSDVYSATLSTKSITFSRAQTGWLFREDKTVGLLWSPSQFQHQSPVAKGHTFGTFWWEHAEVFQTPT